MMNQIFRLTFVTFVWKKYKRVIISLVALLFSLWMIEQIHQDFVQYSQLNNDTSYLAVSFIIKWVVFLLAAGLFIFVNTILKTKTSPSKKPSQIRSKKRFFYKTSSPDKTSLSKAADDSSKPQSDPFDAIRSKTKLRSKADLVLEPDKKKQ
ncbi:hypothetical protein [Marinomonas algicola]|uniref:hypothetical protein n=1 Tax=Marinomonas algicola TaxID=2773454 RepID=UPI00174B3D4A|nr:hypothetical protein [Marinomonas algicola]